MTDASLLRWGAHLDGNMVQGTWSKQEIQYSINWLELKAILSTHVVWDTFLSMDGQHDGESL